MRRRRLLAPIVSLSLATGLSVLAIPIARAADPVTVLDEDFEDGAYASLTQSGGATLSVVPDDGDSALLAKGRVNDYDRVKTPANILQPGSSYTLSMQIKLSAGTVGTADARFVVEPGYDWVGNTAVSAAAGPRSVASSPRRPARTRPLCGPSSAPRHSVPPTTTWWTTS